MSNAGQFATRFETGAERYDRFRPAYPAALLAVVARAVEAVPGGGPVVDVGAGTGIFTRQLAAALPDVPVIGVEPSAAMREQAVAHGGQGLAFVEGAAESLPFDSGSARGVTAAAAAHWFDRPSFYDEVCRVLAPGGVLALLDYPRDVEASPAAAASDAFLAENGEGRAYVRPDYVAELRDRPGFDAPVLHTQAVVTEMSSDDFVGLVLSSSHARAVEANLGVAETEQALHALARDFADDAGRVRYGVRFRLVVATRI